MLFRPINSRSLFISEQFHEKLCFKRHCNRQVRHQKPLASNITSGENVLARKVTFRGIKEKIFKRLVQCNMDESIFFPHLICALVTFKCIYTIDLNIL